MRKIWIILFASMFAIACNTDKQNGTKEKENNQDLTVINGKFENNNDKFVFVTYNSQTDTLAVNENGEFTANILLSSPTHILVVSGNNFVNMYGMPKSKIKFTADKANFWNTAKFTGDVDVVNNYLVEHNKTVQIAGINSENFLYASKYETFAASLEGLMVNINALFNNFIETHGEKYPDFVNLETERLKLLEGSLLLSYYTPILNSEKTIDEAEQKITSLVESTDLNNKNITSLSEFTPFIQNLLGYLINKDIKEQNLEITSAEAYAEMYFNKIDEYILENTVREEIYYNFIKDFMSYYGAESVVEIYNRYKDFATNKTRLTELEKVFGEYSKLAKGQPSVNWSFSDIDGNTYSLSNFKGKYVYIDVWASWCGPCKVELPYLEKLKTTFKDKNVEIIQISVDENREDWVKLMEKENLTGIQLYAGGWDNELCNFFKISGIPRFILLDTEGNIINANADRPSGNIEDILNNLEGI